MADCYVGGIAELLALILRDAGRLQHDAARRDGLAEALYDEDDVQEVLGRRVTHAYGVPFSVGRGLEARLRRAGHILGSATVELRPPRTEETGTWMEALHGRTSPHYVEAIDIPNDGHIPNLPAGSIVEVPGVIDPSGARGFAIGELPPAIASLCQNMLVAHESAVEACVYRSREAALSSLAFEPTVHDLSIVEDLLDALLDVNGN